MPSMAHNTFQYCISPAKYSSNVWKVSMIKWVEPGGMSMLLSRHDSSSSSHSCSPFTQSEEEADYLSYSVFPVLSSYAQVSHTSDSPSDYYGSCQQADRSLYPSWRSVHDAIASSRPLSHQTSLLDNLLDYPPLSVLRILVVFSDHLCLFSFVFLI